jgi:hypothetical protein
MKYQYYAKKIANFLFGVCSYATFIALLSSILMNAMDFIVIHLLCRPKPDFVFSLGIIVFSAVFSIRHYRPNLLFENQPHSKNQSS